MSEETPQTAIAKVDWQRIEHEYITGSDELTLEALAQRYGFVEKTLRNRASEGQWLSKRGNFRENAGKIALQKRAEERAEQIAQEETQLQAAWTETLYEMLRRAREATKSHEARDYVTAAAICADKRRQSLYPEGAPADARAYSKVTVTREEWLTGEWRQHVNDTTTVGGVGAR